jgi:hypothetical protein
MPVERLRREPHRPSHATLSVEQAASHDRGATTLRAIRDLQALGYVAVSVVRAVRGRWKSRRPASRPGCAVPALLTGHRGCRRSSHPSPHEGSARESPDVTTSLLIQKEALVKSSPRRDVAGPPPPKGSHYHSANEFRWIETSSSTQRGSRPVPNSPLRASRTVEADLRRLLIRQAAPTRECRSRSRRTQRRSTRRGSVCPLAPFNRAGGVPREQAAFTSGHLALRVRGSRSVRKAPVRATCPVGEGGVELAQMLCRWDHCRGHV